MNILIFGATGRTGRLFAQAAVSKNHKVTAIIRDKTKATVPDVTYLEGSLMDEKLLNTALPGALFGYKNPPGIIWGNIFS